MSCNGKENKIDRNKADSTSAPNTIGKPNGANEERHPLPHDELTQGVVSLKENAKGTIKIYNSNGTVWDAIDLSNDSVEVKGIKPYSIKLEDQHLIFRCIGQTQNFYTVIADEESGLLKYIEKSDSSFLFESWEKHILTAFSVDFNEKANPIKEMPDSTSKNLTYHKDMTYIPVETRDNWLKVKWGNIYDDNPKYQLGWIRWRSENKLLIELFYTE